MCAEMRFLVAVLLPSMMSISPLLGQSGPYIQTAGALGDDTKMKGEGAEEMGDGGY